MPKYPIYLELRDRRVVIIGGGNVAARKTQTLLEAGARLIIVAPKVDESIENLCRGTNAQIVRSSYAKNFLAGAVIAIAATDDLELNKQIYKDCQELDVLCNAVDQPDVCDFFVPAVVKRGGLQIAVSTDGNCPAYAGHIREKLEKIFTEEHGLFLAALEKIREKIITSDLKPDQRKSVLGQLVNDESFDFFKQNGSAKWFDRAANIISKQIA